MQGGGRQQVFHQANIVERLKNLLSFGPAGWSQASTPHPAQKTAKFHIAKVKKLAHNRAPVM
jgi:hypothetical protein